MKLKSINPSNNQVIGEVEISTEDEIKSVVANARSAQSEWHSMGVSKRLPYLQKLYDICVENRDKLGQLITQEMGMPAKDRDLIELDSGLDYFKWYLQNAKQYLNSEISYEDEQMKNEIHYEPYGVAAVIQPWNYPFCQWSWSAIPALIAGNTVVYKSSEEVPFSNKFIEELVLKSELPNGVLNFVYGAGDIGDLLVHQNIDLIIFTGSTKTGQYLYQVAAEKFIKANLELGGSAPGIVFEDASLEDVVSAVMINRFGNTGQNCDGLKRLIVHESRFEEVKEALVKELNSKKTGDAKDSDTDFGPLVAERQVVLLESQVNDSIAKGAKAEIGGKRPDLNGAYFEPTILTNIKTNMRVWREEVFGPVLPIISFKSEAEAIELANDTQYGLGGYVFSKDIERAERVAKAIKTGMVAINSAFYLVPASPFGGYKQSGLGREHGKYGLHDLCQIKVIAVPK